MSCGGAEEKQWSCGNPGAVNLQRVGSIVRDIGEPCLAQSPIKVSRMLKPDKWQAIFDNEGKVFGFQKALKLIVLGGVDPAIRPEVWEFLLGCYSLGSTAEYRRQLRTARRERYWDLIRQCQMMHSSIGTGALAFIVGSKVMDMRTSSTNGSRRDAEAESGQAFADTVNKLVNCSNWNNNCAETSYAHESESSSDSGELVCVRGSTENGAYDSSCFVRRSGMHGCGSPQRGAEAHGSEYLGESFLDFPSLPVTDLFDRGGGDNEESNVHDTEPSMGRKSRFKDDRMHSFQINNNVDLFIESNGSPSNNTSHHDDSEIEAVHHEDYAPGLQPTSMEYGKETVNNFRISDALGTPLFKVSSQGGATGEDRVSEWLWTLHRIVVDVVRTDSHLEFYEDKKNLARMSDILAVYAWVDPATGYCQGMSDLLSPFVVLFEDNADAFWCFEMLLRRMRENFRMEGPTRVMKQLQALLHILELTDKEMFAHLSRIGAESLHFAFRMLMVLFRRELSFNEALQMWEMMWAADYDETLAYDLENCLEALMLPLSRNSGVEMGEEIAENCHGSSNESALTKLGNVEHPVSESTAIKSASGYPFCGLTRSFWSRSESMQISNLVSSTKNVDAELPVFCVAAILIMNRQKIIRETRSIDDMIKIFNDKLLKIHVKRCIRSAIKLRKKYFYKLIKIKSPPSQNCE